MTAMHRFFTQGPVPEESLRSWSAEFASDENAGATSIFIGRVRADRVVTGIEYTAHEPMAIAALEAIISRFLYEPGVRDIRVLHALGLVPVGQAAMIVAVNSGHRQEAFGVIEQVVNAIKTEAPIYGKELTVTDGHRWKTNLP